MVVLKSGGGGSSFKGERGRGSVTAGVLRRKIL